MMISCKVSPEESGRLVGHSQLPTLSLSQEIKHRLVILYYIVSEATQNHNSPGIPSSRVAVLDCIWARLPFLFLLFTAWGDQSTTG